MSDDLIEIERWAKRGTGSQVEMSRQILGLTARIRELEAEVAMLREVNKSLVDGGLSDGAQGVGVKPLEWRDEEVVFSDGVSAKLSDALGHFGHRVQIYRHADGRIEWCGPGTEDYAASVEAAKAAAQADYERRILSAITPAPVTKGFHSEGMWIRISEDGTYETPYPAPVTVGEAARETAPVYLYVCSGIYRKVGTIKLINGEPDPAALRALSGEGE